MIFSSVKLFCPSVHLVAVDFALRQLRRPDDVPITDLVGAHPITAELAIALSDDISNSF